MNIFALVKRKNLQEFPHFFLVHPGQGSSEAVYLAVHPVHLWACLLSWKVLELTKSGPFLDISLRLDLPALIDTETSCEWNQKLQSHMDLLLDKEGLISLKKEIEP